MWSRAGWIALSGIVVAGTYIGCSGTDQAATATGAASSSSGSTGTGGSDTGKCAAAPNAPFSDPLIYLGRAAGDEFVEVLDVVADHPMVYACTSVQGLNIWDATADGPPALLATRVVPPGYTGMHPHCQHVGLDSSNHRLVITNRGDEIEPTPFIHLFDVTNPANPVPLRGWTGPESIEGAVLAGNRIYAAAHTAGILVFEDQGGSNLVEVGRFSDAQSDAWKPVLSGNRLVVAEGSAGLRIYDISAPNPVLVSSVPIEGSSNDVVIDDGTAYVAASSHIAAVDVRAPDQPVLLSTIESTGTAVGLAVGLNDTLLGAEWEKVRGYDISDPAQMTQELSEVLPTSKLFSRVLTVDAAPAAGRFYPGEWSGVHAYRQEPCGIGPDIEVTPEGVSFASIAPGGLDVRALIVRNHGNRPLQVNAITSDDPTMTLSEQTLQVAAGGVGSVEVTFKPTSTQKVTARVTFSSDDPDQPNAVVRVTGNVPGVDIGDPVPAFSLADTDGNTWTNTQLQGNIAVLAYFATF
jgi:hypothetical protein